MKIPYGEALPGCVIRLAIWRCISKGICWSLLGGSWAVRHIADSGRWSFVRGIVARLSTAELEADFPEKVFGAPISTQQLLISLHGHLNDHLGQIDYLRRFLGQGEAVELVGL